ncbi:MAG: hypothetical protein ACOZQL_34080 [Myxococcota bacterium]
MTIAASFGFAPVARVVRRATPARCVRALRVLRAEVELWDEDERLTVMGGAPGRES